MIIVQFSHFIQWESGKKPIFQELTSVDVLMIKDEKICLKTGAGGEPRGGGAATRMAERGSSGSPNENNNENCTARQPKRTHIKVRC